MPCNSLPIQFSINKIYSKDNSLPIYLFIYISRKCKGESILESGIVQNGPEVSQTIVVTLWAQQLQEQEHSLSTPKRASAFSQYSFGSELSRE